MTSLKDILGAGALAVLAGLILLISPMIFLWAVNSLSEAGGSSFYIEHGLWNYLVSFLLVCLLRGGK